MVVRAAGAGLRVAAALHHAAAGWYERQGLPDDAIGHALAAGDQEWAAQIVETQLERQLWRSNESATLDRWLTALSPEVVRGHARLVLGQAIVAVLGGRLDDVESLLAAVEHGIPQADTDAHLLAVTADARTIAGKSVWHADRAVLDRDCRQVSTG